MSGVNTKQTGPSLKDKIVRVLRLKSASLLPAHAPDFLLLGAQKAGTSSLYTLLKKHPQIMGAIDKEVHFFDRDDHWSKGQRWYESQFASIRMPSSSNLYFEATPDYMYRKGAVQRMHSLYPDLKLIIILREPVSRAYSAWNMFRDFQVSRKRLPALLQSGYLNDRENNLMTMLYEVDQYPSFEEVVELELKWIEEDVDWQEPSFIRRGFYMDQIEEVLKYYDRDQLLILSQGELRTKEGKTLDIITRFLDLPDTDWGASSPGDVKNARVYPKPIDQEVKRRLEKIYAPHNDRLFEFLGRSLW